MINIAVSAYRQKTNIGTSLIYFLNLQSHNLPHVIPSRKEIHWVSKVNPWNFGLAWGLLLFRVFFRVDRMSQGTWLYTQNLAYFKPPSNVLKSFSTWVILILTYLFRCSHSEYIKILRCYSGSVLLFEYKTYLIPTHTWYLLRNSEFCAQILFKMFSPREQQNEYGRFCV